MLRNRTEGIHIDSKNDIKRQTAGVNGSTEPLNVFT